MSGRARASLLMRRFSPSYSAGSRPASKSVSASRCARFCETSAAAIRRPRSKEARSPWSTWASAWRGWSSETSRLEPLGDAAEGLFEADVGGLRVLLVGIRVGLDERGEALSGEGVDVVASLDEPRLAEVGPRVQRKAFLGRMLSEGGSRSSAWDAWRCTDGHAFAAAWSRRCRVEVGVVKVHGVCLLLAEECGDQRAEQLRSWRARPFVTRLTEAPTFFWQPRVQMPQPSRLTTHDQSS